MKYCFRVGEMFECNILLGNQIADLKAQLAQASETAMIELIKPILPKVLGVFFIITYIGVGIETMQKLRDDEYVDPRVVIGFIPVYLICLIGYCIWLLVKAVIVLFLNIKRN